MSVALMLSPDMLQCCATHTHQSCVHPKSLHVIETSSGSTAPPCQTVLTNLQSWTDTRSAAAKRQTNLSEPDGAWYNQLFHDNQVTHDISSEKGPRKLNAYNILWILKYNCYTLIDAYADKCCILSILFYKCMVLEGDSALAASAN